jgi:ABC-type transport system involved in Fe-S cluster assembly fused permease/ATPase subunit
MTPDNAGWYHAAYVVAIAVYAIYTVALWRRRARVRAELEKAGAPRG